MDIGNIVGNASVNGLESPARVRSRPGPIKILGRVLICLAITTSTVCAGKDAPGLDGSGAGGTSSPRSTPRGTEFALWVEQVQTIVMSHWSLVLAEPLNSGAGIAFFFAPDGSLKLETIRSSGSELYDQSVSWAFQKAMAQGEIKPPPSESWANESIGVWVGINFNYAPGYVSPTGAAPMLQGKAAAQLKSANDWVKSGTQRIPTYPYDALTKSITGWTDLEVTLTADGSVSGVRSQKSNPVGVFELTSIVAALGSSFALKIVDGVAVSRTGVRRFKFDLGVPPPVPAATP